MKRVGSGYAWRVVGFALGLATTAAWGPTAAHASRDVYGALGIEPSRVLRSSLLTSRVLPGEGRQVVAIVTFLTGQRDEARAVDVRFAVLQPRGEEHAVLYQRDLGEERGGYVAQGEVALFDLDADGVNEIVLSYDDLSDPLVRQRRAEVLLYEDGRGYRSVWSGLMLYDATRAARKVPPERRDHYAREVDFEATLRTRGKTLILRKTVWAVAGERLERPEVLTESVPLRR